MAEPRACVSTLPPKTFHAPMAAMAMRAKMMMYSTVVSPVSSVERWRFRGEGRVNLSQAGENLTDISNDRSNERAKAAF
ncbi:MAG: hypothetical protein ACI9KE_004731 [Polyangiales bacterium]